MNETQQAAAAGSRRIRAAGIAGLVAIAALAANVGRIAESPLAGAVPALQAIGPGKIGKLRSLTVDEKGQPPRGIDRIGRDALAGAPLAYEPFFAVAAAGFAGDKANGSANDARLLREAIRRNARSRESHFFLLRHEIGAGNTAGAINEIGVLNRLSKGAADKMISGLGQAIRSEKQVDEAVGALKRHPELFAPFLAGFTKQTKPQALSVRMIGSIPKSALADPAVRELAVKELVRGGAFGEARRIWGGTSAEANPVYSPDFTDAAAPPPFNWDVLANDTGVAERRPSGGLELDYYGRHPGPLVTQLVTLAPGAYQARIEYRTTSGSPGAIAVQLTCPNGGPTLLSQPLDAPVGRDQVLLVRFGIAQGACAGQQLTIGGRVQESRDAQQATVRRVTIERSAN